METLLSALAGCSALDVIHIMKKQRQNLDRLEVDVEGERADAIPAVFTKIDLRLSRVRPDRTFEAAAGGGALDGEVLLGIENAPNRMWILPQRASSGSSKGHRHHQEARHASNHEGWPASLLSYKKSLAIIVASSFRPECRCRLPSRPLPTLFAPLGKN